MRREMNNSKNEPRTSPKKLSKNRGNGNRRIAGKHNQRRTTLDHAVHGSEHDRIVDLRIKQAAQFAGDPLEERTVIESRESEINLPSDEKYQRGPPGSGSLAQHLDM